MAVELSSLPVDAQEKISKMQIPSIQKIIAHDYPSGQTEVSVYGKDTNGWNYCIIFSF